jgi:hypothetical protein
MSARSFCLHLYKHSYQTDNYSLALPKVVQSAIKSFYDRLRQSGKSHKVALIACMRKTLVVLNAMVKNQTFWQKPINFVETEHSC